MWIIIATVANVKGVTKSKFLKDLITRLPPDNNRGDTLNAFKKKATSRVKLNKRRKPSCPWFCEKVLKWEDVIFVDNDLTTEVTEVQDSVYIGSSKVTQWSINSRLV